MNTLENRRMNTRFFSGKLNIIKPPAYPPFRPSPASSSLHSEIRKHLFSVRVINAVMWIRIDSQNLINPDPVRIQVNKITKFSKHCWLNSAFPFILSVILHLWIRIRPAGCTDDRRGRCSTVKDERVQSLFRDV